MSYLCLVGLVVAGDLVGRLVGEVLGESVGKIIGRPVGGELGEVEGAEVSGAGTQCTSLMWLSST